MLFLYYYYFKNLLDNLLDNFFCYFSEIDIFEDLNSVYIYAYEFFDILKYALALRFSEFFFFLKKFIFSIRKKYSFFFFFFSIFSDIFLGLFLFMSSHLAIFVKIYKDYVHNYSRKNFLELLTLFSLFFLFLFFMIYFF